jgi:hypothetical protein
MDYIYENLITFRRRWGGRMTKEAKQAKFEELAEKRVVEAIKRLRLVGKLSNRNNYFYTDEHVKQIIRRLDSEVKNLKTVFDTDKGADEIDFKFK